MPSFEQPGEPHKKEDSEKEIESVKGFVFNVIIPVIALETSKFQKAQDSLKDIEKLNAFLDTAQFHYLTNLVINVLIESDQFTDVEVPATQSTMRKVGEEKLDVFHKFLVA